MSKEAGPKQAADGAMVVGKRARTDDGVPACKQSHDKTPHV
jgi:hypothetical protein